MPPGLLNLRGSFFYCPFRHAGHVYAVASVYAPTYRDERCQFFVEQLLPLFSPVRAPLTPRRGLQLCCR